MTIWSNGKSPLISSSPLFPGTTCGTLRVEKVGGVQTSIVLIVSEAVKEDFGFISAHTFYSGETSRFCPTRLVARVREILAKTFPFQDRAVGPHY